MCSLMRSPCVSYVFSYLKRVDHTRRHPYMYICICVLVCFLYVFLTCSLYIKRVDHTLRHPYMYICICICIKTHVRICIAVAIRTCISVYVYAYTHICICVHAYAYMHSIHAYAYMHTRIPVAICTCISVYVYVYTQICIWIHAYPLPSRAPSPPLPQTPAPGKHVPRWVRQHRERYFGLVRGWTRHCKKIQENETASRIRVFWKVNALVYLLHNYGHHTWDFSEFVPVNG